MSLCVNQSGTWRNITTLCINDSGTWTNESTGASDAISGTVAFNTASNDNKNNIFSVRSFRCVAY